MLLAVKRSHSGRKEVEKEGKVGACGINRKKASVAPLLNHEWRGKNIAGVALPLAVTALEFDPINL